MASAEVTIGLHVSDQGSMAERRRSSRLISPKTPSRWASCWPTSRCGARYTATLARGNRPSAASGIGSHKVCGIRRRRPRVLGSIPKSEPVNLRDASVSSPTGSESNRPQPSISSLPRWSVTVPHGAKRRCRPSRLRRMRMCMFFLRHLVSNVSDQGLLLAGQPQSGCRVPTGFRVRSKQ